MPDYMPAPDADFDNWLDTFVAKVTASPTSYGLVAGDLTGLSAASSDWKSKYPAHLAAVGAAGAARAAKDAARVATVAIVRPLVRRIQASPATDDGDRAVLGITIPGENTSPGGAPTTMPMLMVMCERLRHTLSWTDSATPTKKAKPPGVLGAEIRMALTAVGAPTPTDPALFGFLVLDTASPYTVEFLGTDGGKNAHYLIRWVSNGNQHGPWSETVSMTIGV